jgi:hypothetical protein
MCPLDDYELYVSYALIAWMVPPHHCRRESPIPPHSGLVGGTHAGAHTRPGSRQSTSSHAGVLY